MNRCPSRADTNRCRLQNMNYLHAGKTIYHMYEYPKLKIILINTFKVLIKLILFLKLSQILKLRTIVYFSLCEFKDKFF